MMQMNLQNRRLTDLQNKLMVAGGRWGEGVVKAFGRDMYTLLYLKLITKDRLCSTGKSAQCYMAAGM